MDYYDYKQYATQRELLFTKHLTHHVEIVTKLLVPVSVVH